MTTPAHEQEPGYYDGLSDDEFLDILGPAPTPLRLVNVPQGLPTAEKMVRDQTRDAFDRLHEDTTNYPAFPWPELDDLAGLMCPEDLWMIAGRTGHGKSLFLLNLFDRLIADNHAILYVGLEQSPKILRTKWAALRAGIPAKRVLAPSKAERSSGAFQSVLEAIEPQIRWQREQPQAQLAHFATTRFVTREGLVAWTEWAVEHGCSMIIVDHIDRMHHGDGKNSFHDLSETVRLAKELATEHRIVMCMASQVGRPNGDHLQKFQPPALHDLRGSGRKEEEADAVLAVYRPLKSGVTDSEMTQARQGRLAEGEIYELDLMAVKVLKHRLDGDMSLKNAALLTVTHGRLGNRPTRSFGRYDP